VFAHEKHLFFFLSHLAPRDASIRIPFRSTRESSDRISRRRDHEMHVVELKSKGKLSFHPGNDTPPDCEGASGSDGCLRQSREQLERRWAIGRCYLEKYSPSMWRGAMLCRYATAVSVRCTNHRTCPCMAFACVATRERERELDDVCSRAWLHRYRRGH